MARQRGQRQRMRRLVDVDQVDQLVEVGPRITDAVQPPDQHRRLLRRPGVQEAEPRLDVRRGAQPQQRRALADAQQVAERVAGPGDVGSARLDRRVGQQRSRQGPVVGVVPRGRQAHAEVVVGIGPVQPVEPVAAVVAVAVQRFAAQRVAARMEICHPLAERIDRAGQDLHAGAVLAAGAGRQAEHVVVEQGEVVVVLDVVDDLARLQHPAGGNAADVDLLEPQGLVPARLHLEAADRARHRRADPVRLPHQLAARLAGVPAVAVIEEAVHVALVGPQRRARIAAAAAAHRVADQRIEAADARAVQRQHLRLHETRAVGDLAEVPALADDLHLASSRLRHAGLQRLHDRARMVAHDVEAQRADAVVARPDDRRVDHELAHHEVLGRGVLAAGRALDAAAGVVAEVVVRHDLVEHRGGGLARRGRVVVDQVHAHPQARRVERLHHAAELDHPRHRIARVARVAALGRREMLRVVAPVEAVGGGRGGHGGLLGLAVGRAGGRGRHAALLVDGGEVEGGQQVHVGQSRRGQRRQMPHAVGAALGEGQVLATPRRGHGRVVDGEVAHVQLVDAQVRRRVHRRRRPTGVPAGRLGGAGVEVHHHALLPAQRHAPRVGIGHQLAHQSHALDEHLHLVAIGRPLQAAGLAQLPDAGRGIAGHGLRRRAGQRGRADRRGQHQLDVLRGRGPDLEAGAAPGHDGAQVWHLVGGRIEVVERAGDLGGRRVQHPAVGVDLRQHQLLLMQGGQARDVVRAHREDPAAGHVLEAPGRGLRHGAGEGVQRDEAVGARHRRAGGHGDLAGGRVVQPHAAAGADAGPLDQRLVEPHRARIGAGHLAQVRRCGVDGGVALDQPDLTDAVLHRQRAELDAQVVVAAVLVVLVGRHAVDDEFQPLAAGVVPRIEHRQVEDHLVAAHRMPRHRAERDRLVPAVDGDAGGRGGRVQAAAAPQVQAPGRVVGVEALVMDAHRREVGRRLAQRVAGVGRAVALQAPDFVGPGLQDQGLVGAAVVLLVALVEEEADRAAAGRERHVVVHAEVVAPAGVPAFVPVGTAGRVPGVDLPAGRVAIGAAVVDAQRGGRRVRRGDRGGACAAGAAAGGIGNGGEHGDAELARSRSGCAR